MIVDLRNASEANGKSTTYYAGLILIDGVEHDIDGMTDRGDNWLDLVLEAIEAKDDDIDTNELFDQLDNEMDLGEWYEVTISNGVVTIKKGED